MKIPKFRQRELFEQALTHRSALNEPRYKQAVSNERLEFLGDAVLELVTTDFLYRELPDEPEGRLTVIRSSLVKTTALAEVARELELGQKLYLSRGELNSGGRENDALLADTLEALIGALYLDQGLAGVQKFLAETVLGRFEEVIEKQLYLDSKSVLQEEVQAFGYETPFYQVVREEGPDHDKTFEVMVTIAGRQFGVGTGKSKRVAQQLAARSALEKFRLEVNDLKK